MLSRQRYSYSHSYSAEKFTELFVFGWIVTNHYSVHPYYRLLLVWPDATLECRVTQIWAVLFCILSATFCRKESGNPAYMLPARCRQYSTATDWVSLLYIGTFVFESHPTLSGFCLLTHLLGNSPLGFFFRRGNSHSRFFPQFNVVILQHIAPLFLKSV